MKNKEIEELLNNIKDKYSYDPYDTTGNVYTTISYEEGQLLLSYIEQLENKNKENSLLLIEFQDMEQRIEQLENNRDKALKIIDSYELGKYDYSIPPGGIIELREALKGEIE